ncbi:MAG: tyrosine-type recombinase/integrase [Candidatus Acidiferrales bacterium]
METNQAVQVAEPASQKPRHRANRRGQRGSIFRRPGSSSYTIIFRATSDGGKQKQKWEGGFRTKEDAQKRLDIVLGSIRENRYAEPKDVLFRDFCDERMKSWKPTLKPKTWASYQSALNRWIAPNSDERRKELGTDGVPILGDWSISAMNRSLAKSFVGHLLGMPGLSRKFVKNVAILLHRLFEEAIDLEYVATNPFRKMHIPMTESADLAESHDVIVPTPEEVVKTFARLPPTYQVLLATSAFTGARRGELLGLKWEDIDWLNSLIQIRRTLQRLPESLLDGGRFRGVDRLGDSCLALVSPKSKKARRSIEFPPKLTDLFKALRASQKSHESSFVFQNEIGQPLDPDGVYDVIHAAQDKAGARRFGLHGLRHLYSSLLVASGADVKFAQDRLGHASALTTLNIYSHAMTEHGREYAATIEASFPFVSNLLAEGKKDDSKSERPN